MVKHANRARLALVKYILTQVQVSDDQMIAHGFSPEDVEEVCNALLKDHFFRFVELSGPHNSNTTTFQLTPIGIEIIEQLLAERHQLSASAISPNQALNPSKNKPTS